MADQDGPASGEKEALGQASEGLAVGVAGRRVTGGQHHKVGVQVQAADLHGVEDAVAARFLGLGGDQERIRPAPVRTRQGGVSSEEQDAVGLQVRPRRDRGVREGLAGQDGCRSVGAEGPDGGSGLRKGVGERFEAQDGAGLVDTGAVACGHRGDAREGSLAAQSGGRLHIVTLRGGISEGEDRVWRAGRLDLPQADEGGRTH